MSVSNQGMAYCTHCGAEYRLFTIFNRDMQGLCKAWKQRHEHACVARTPEQRRKWARPYIGKDRYDSSIIVDLNHPGFLLSTAAKFNTAEEWFAALLRIAEFPEHDHITGGCALESTC